VAAAARNRSQAVIVGTKRVKALRVAHIDPDKLYSVDEAAAIASTSRRTLLRELSRGRVPVVMLGGRKIQGAELARWLMRLEKPCKT
jgi:excisionase family DNA binding protein